MVLRACRHALGDSHDADDAFQATFLVLARKAGSAWKADSVAGWLHGVALRVARRARADAARRVTHERRWAEMRPSAADRGTELADSWPAIHEEIDRLPGRYREPLVLHYLEGLTIEQVAGRLGCPRGTVLSRLSRGREQLRGRLSRRGLTPCPTPGTTAFLTGADPAVVSRPLFNAAVRSAIGKLDGPGAAGVVSASVSPMSEAVMGTLSWSRWAAVAIVGSAMTTLAVVVGAALAHQDAEQDGRVAPSPKALQAPSNQAAGARDATAAFTALPARGELHRLLRVGASEASALARMDPEPSSRALMTIATAQAKAGDLEGARATFADAALEAGGKFGGAASSTSLANVGLSQAEAGLVEAKQTLQVARGSLPGIIGDFDPDHWTVMMFGRIIRGQARIGDREEARKTADLLLIFVKSFIRGSKISNARDVVAAEVAAALASAGDFDAAFSWSEKVENRGNVLGEIALAASSYLDREVARRFVREAAERHGRIELPERSYLGLGALAEAQARIGEVDAAKRTAKVSGGGPFGDEPEMTALRVEALCRVSGVESKAGDLVGARQTLRDAVGLLDAGPRTGGRSGRYRRIARGQMAVGDLDGATRSFEATKGRNPEDLALLARAQAARGEHAEARATFGRALGEVDRLVAERTTPDSELAELAEVQAMAGDVPGALKAARAIFDETRRAWAAERVVAARAMAGDVAGALKLVQEDFKSPEERRGAVAGLGMGVAERLDWGRLDGRPE